MVNFYVNRINNNKMKLEDVPPKWKAAVEAELHKDKCEAEE